MAYKYTKGTVYRGDIYNEDDTQRNTYLDWDEDYIGMVTSGSATLVVSGSKVGIGTTAPQADLHISSSGDEVLFRVDGNTPDTPVIFVTGSGNEGRIGFGTATPEYTFDLVQSEAGTPYEMRVKSTAGHVSLNLDAAAGTDPRLYFDIAGTSQWLIKVEDTDQTLQFIDAGSAKNVVFTQDGRVGIGTAVPGHELTVVGNISASSNVSASVVHVYNEIHYAQSAEETANFTIGEPLVPLYRVDTSSNVVTASLPSLVGALDGLCLNIKDVGLSASTNNVVIAPNGSDTIDGATSLKIQANGGSVGLQADPDSAEWYIVFTN